MEVASLIARFGVEGAETIPRAAGRAHRSLDDLSKTADRTGPKIGGVFSTALGFAGGDLISTALGGVTDLIGGMIGANAQAETYRQSLEVAVGSQKEANALFADVQKMAANTPFEFPELIQAATQLEAFGLDSTEWLDTIGDTAAATNKSVGQIADAVLDATTGEFERLKELGVRTKDLGGGMVEMFEASSGKSLGIVDRNNGQMIQSTLETFWNSKYDGAMSKQANTFAGRYSTLRDNIRATMMSASNGAFQILSSGIAFANDVFARGWEAAFTDAFGPGVTGLIGDFAGAVGTAFDAVRGVTRGFVRAFEAGDRVKDLVKDLPTPLQGVATALFTVADGLGDMARAALAGDWMGVFREGWDTLRNLVSSGLDLGRVAVGAAVDLAGDLYDMSLGVAGWIWDKIGVWDGLLNGGEAVAASLSAVVDFTSNIVGDVWDWITGKIMGGPADDGTGIREAGTAGKDIPIGTVLVTAFVKLGELAGDLYGDLKAAVANLLFGSGVQTTAGIIGHGEGGGGNAEVDGGLIGVRLGLSGAKWSDDVDWAGAAATLLQDLSEGLDSALGLDRTEGEVGLANQQGQAIGASWRADFMAGLTDGLKGGGAAAPKGADGSTPDGGVTPVFEGIREIFAASPFPESDQQSIIDEWLAVTDGIALDLHNAIADGLTDFFRGGDVEAGFAGSGHGSAQSGSQVLADQMIGLFTAGISGAKALLDDKLLTPLQDFSDAAFATLQGWSDGLGSLFSGLFGGGGMVDNRSGQQLGGSDPGSVVSRLLSGMWGTIKDALTPDLSGIDGPSLPGWVTDPSQWLDLGPLGEAVKAIRTIGDDLKSAWDWVHFWENGGPKGFDPYGGMGSGADVTGHGNQEQVDRARAAERNRQRENTGVPEGGSVLGIRSGVGGNPLEGLFGGGGGVVPAPDFSEFVAAVTATTDSMEPAGRDMIVGFGRGMRGYWPEILSWLGGIPAAAAQQVGPTLATLEPAGTGLMIGLGRGARGYWTDVAAWLGGVPAGSARSVGATDGALEPAGTGLMVGFGRGMRGYWPAITGWLGGISGAVGGYVGGGDALYNAGASIMQGFWRGLADTWARVAQWLSNIHPERYKGPPERDAKMLVGAGRLVMGGFGEGLADGWGGVQRQLTGYVPSLSPVGVPLSPRGGGAGLGRSDGGGGNTYVFEGCVIGADVEKWVDARVASGAAKVMDRSYARNRMGESRG